MKYRNLFLALVPAAVPTTGLAQRAADCPAAHAPSHGYVQRSAMLVALALAVTTWSGCITVKLFIDPSYHTATYRDIQPPTAPLPVKVAYTFYRHDKAVAKATEVLEKKANRVLEATTVFRPDATAGDRLQVSLINTGDTGQAVAKGLATGATLGIVGSHVVDRYEMRVAYVARNGREFGGTFAHALHATVGVKSAPPGMQPVAIADAIDQVIEDLLLRYLVEFQRWQATQGVAPAERPTEGAPPTA